MPGTVNATPEMGLPLPDNNFRGYDTWLRAALSQLSASALGGLAIRPTDLPTVPPATSFLPSTSLKINIAAGVKISGTGVRLTYPGVNNLVLPASQTTYLWLDDTEPTPVLQQGTSYPVGVTITPLGRVTTNATQVTAIVDDRPIVGTGVGPPSGAIYRGGGSVTVANTTTETTLVPALGLGEFKVPPDYWTAGRTLRIKAFGSGGSTGTPTLTFRVYIGATLVSTVTVSPTWTSAGWTFECDLSCYATGLTGTIAAGASLVSPQQAGAAGTTTVDTTVSNPALNLTAQWSVADAANTLTLTNLTLEAL
jgi:hypothetical protein